MRFSNILEVMQNQDDKVIQEKTVLNKALDNIEYFFVEDILLDQVNNGFKHPSLGRFVLCKSLLKNNKKFNPRLLIDYEDIVFDFLKKISEKYKLSIEHKNLISTTRENILRLAKENHPKVAI
jgi:hypothetical protein